MQDAVIYIHTYSTPNTKQVLLSQESTPKPKASTPSQSKYSLTKEYRRFCDTEE